MKHIPCIFLVFWLAPSFALCAESLNTDSLARSLRNRVSVTWDNKHLIDVIQRLEETQGINIWLDRRIDPKQMVMLQVRDKPVSVVLETLAKDLDLGVSRLGKLVYLGPRKAAANLEHLSLLARSTLSKATPKWQREWLREEQREFPELTQPRIFLENCLRKEGIRMTGAEQIPHDLWRAMELPELSLIDQSVFVLIGFHLTLEVTHQGSDSKIVPIRDTMLPESRTKPLTSHKDSQRNDSQRLYSLKITNQPVGSILDHLAKQLQLKIVWHPSLASEQATLKKALVSCEVANADLGSMLNSILRPIGLEHRQKGQTITLSRLPPATP